MFRVASAIPRELAIAAICASTCETGRPAAWRAADDLDGVDGHHGCEPQTPPVGIVHSRTTPSAPTGRASP